MVKAKKSFFQLIILICTFIMVMTIPCSATSSNPIDNPDYYNPSGSGVDIGASQIKDKANIIIGVIKNIGIVVSVLTLVVLGIKYMLGSLEEKAEYKKTMIPYLIGAFMIFAIPQLVQIIYNIVSKTFANS